MKPVRFHPEAQSELDAAVAYYEVRLQGLGSDLRREIETAAQRIQESPLR